MIRLDRGGTFVALACLLILIPYPLYRAFANERFGGSYGDNLLHAMVAGCILAAMAGGYRLGWYLHAPAPRVARARSVSGGHIALLLWLPVGVAVAAHLSVAAVRLLNPDMSFFEIRLAFEPYAGLGLLFRTYLVALPPIFVLSRRIGRRAWAVLGLLGLLVLIRAGALSERLAVLEYVLAMGVSLSLRHRFTVRLWQAGLGLGVLYFFAAITLWRRVVFQGNFFGSLGDFMHENFLYNITYYAVNLNSLYFRMFSDTPPTELRWYLLPVEKVLSRIAGIRLEDPTAWTDFLIARDNAGYGYFWLNNPGGPTQDYSDWGAAFLIVILVKFMIFGWIARRVQAGSVTALAVFALFCIAVAEYPRFNYFYMSFGFFALMGGLIYGRCISALLASSRSRATRAGS